MGYTTGRVKLYNPRDPSRYLELELLVDTGSTYTWVKRSRLKELGVESMGRRRFKTIENRVIEREIGECVIECLNRRATTIVVLAEESDNEVLGLHVLEGLGLEVVPVTRQPREVEAILATEPYEDVILSYVIVRTVIRD